MKHTLFILLCTLSATAGYSQKWPFEFWHEGKVVLLQGDTLKGNVKYDLQQDMVQFSAPDQRVEAFTARKVLFFEIFDRTVNKYRQFFALPFATNSNYRVPVFFELLEEGKMTLMCREELKTQVYSSPYYYGNYTRVILVYTYFFLDESGDIHPFSGNKNDLIDLMGKQGDQVEKYMKANKLKFDDKYDLVKIVTYYNTLFGT